MELIQNQNESINTILWRHCPKTVMCGKCCINLKKMLNTIGQFNSGATVKSTVYESSRIDTGTNFYKATVDKGKIRMKNATKKISGK